MSAAPTPRAASLASAIRAKVPRMALLGGPAQAAELEAAMQELATAHVGFVRVGNPLVSPLSLERVVLQITRDEADEERREDEERVLRALIARSETRRQLAVVVEQAETLTPEALDFLRGLGTLSHPSLAPVQLVLAGTAALGPRIAQDGTRIIGDPAGPAPQAAPPRTPRKARPRSEVLLLAGLGLCGVAAIAFMVHGPFQFAPAPAPPPAPAPTTTTPPPQVAALASPAAPGLPAAPPPTDAPQPAPAAEPPIPTPPVPPEDTAAARARLYREFTAFLETRGLARRLPPAEREALFHEYLALHQAAPAPAPAAIETARIPGDPRVLLFFAAGSDPERAAAERQAGLLRDRVAGLELRAAPEVPAVPTIRYGFPADRPAALALAQAARAPGGEWQVEDMTASTQRPDPGVVEMWLPRE